MTRFHSSNSYDFTPSFELASLVVKYKDCLGWECEDVEGIRGVLSERVSNLLSSFAIRAMVDEKDVSHIAANHAFRPDIKSDFLQGIPLRENHGRILEALYTDLRKFIGPNGVRVGEGFYKLTDSGIDLYVQHFFPKEPASSSNQCGREIDLQQ